MTVGTVAVSYSSSNGLRAVSFAWTSTAGGLASEITRYAYTGQILKVVTVPGAAAAAPTTLYDISLLDSNGVDVANGQLADRSATATEWVLASLGAVVHSKLTLSVSNAGNAKSGVTTVYIGTGAGTDYVEKLTPNASKVSASIVTGNLFTIAGGPVRVLSLVGQITTAIQASANACKLTHTPTGGAAVDLCATLDVTGAAIRKLLVLNGVKATALGLSTDIGVVAVALQSGMPLVLTPGVIALNGAASTTGVVSWYVEYEPLAVGATITAA